MILQALYDYYQRKAADPDPARRLPAFGLEDKEIPFIVELTAEGRPLGALHQIRQRAEPLRHRVDGVIEERVQRRRLGRVDQRHGLYED